MNSGSIPWWTQIFPVAAGESRAVAFRVLSKHGQPFLVLPEQARFAAEGLQLYPAQRSKARLVVKVLAVLLRAGLPVPMRSQMLAIGREDPLLNFMIQLSGGAMPPFAVLAGNPAAAGRRFILMLWPPGQPATVVKVGVGIGPARALIQQEESFLSQIPASVPGILRVVKSFCSEQLVGFALPFLAGRTPAQLNPAVVQLLQGWLQPGQLEAAQQIKAWNNLRLAAAGTPGWAEIAAVIEARPFARTVAHGDFTPWNVRVGTGIVDRACALDWERGEFPGMPAWDWFHFEIQSAILVRRQPGRALARLCKALLQREDFRAYAAAAGLAGREPAMLLAYLYHVVHVLRPTEGGRENLELLEMLRTDWHAAVKSQASSI